MKCDELKIRGSYCYGKMCCCVQFILIPKVLRLHPLHNYKIKWN